MARDRLEDWRCEADCPGRTSECHAKCERYAEYRRILSGIYKVQAADRDFLAHVQRAGENFRKERKKK